MVCCSDQFIDRIIYPVKMSFCIWTCIRITNHLITKTYFFFCCQCNFFHTQILLPEYFKCLACNRSCNRLRCQIEDFFSQFFSYSFYRRKYCCHRFSHTGRCLDEKFFLSENGPVHGRYQVSLSFPVIKWKFYRLNGCISLFSPFHLIASPFFIFRYQFFEPYFQFFLCI